MIATILPGSADFHAVGYNEHKVSKGLARLIEMRNFGTVGLAGRPTTEELTGYLKKYSSANSRIRKPQFHVAVSCKGREMTESELLDFAHRYLKEMGYAEPGQPWLIYAHHDTDNTHLHIITSRVAPDGRKIAHSHERRRSEDSPQSRAQAFPGSHRQDSRHGQAKEDCRRHGRDQTIHLLLFCPIQGNHGFHGI